jgi:hypothetical protein
MPKPISHSPLPNRREFLWQSGMGMGAVALTWLLSEELRGESSSGTQSPYLAKPPHFPAKAKRVIHIFAAGGVSHVDTFDHKPELEKHHGQALTGKGKYDPFFGQPGNLMKSPWRFQRRGQSGLWVSDLLPHLATCADDITFIHSMVSKSNNHTPATFLANSGFTMNGYPSLGAWLSYGLGSMNEDLPAFVVLPDSRGLPAGGAINWSAGFLPATHQGTAFRTTDKEPIADLYTPAEVGPSAREASLKLLAAMNQQFAAANPGDSGLAARIRSYELAAKMQVSVPEVINFDNESESVKKLYGLDEERTAGFGRNCLLSRRLLERGVRFVQLFNGGAFGSPRTNWDAHEDLMENHTKQAGVMDKPVAGLLKDLKARGMLDDTLVIWSTEFGRTPVTQGLNGKGRDHHQLAFTSWLAGAGLKPGISYGSSDEIGFNVGENPVTTYDFHASILHLLGLEHSRLTFYHNGIQRRLTDVHGEVVKDILA